MENQITSSELAFTDSGEIIIAPFVTLDAELNEIRKETSIARITREFSLYRIYRIMNAQLWRETFDTSDEFIDYINDNFGFSRMTVYERVHAYRTLAYAGYNELDAINMISENPFKFVQVAKEIGSWNRATNEPSLTIAVPDASASTKDNDAEDAPKVQTKKELVREIIDNAQTQPTARQAIEYVRENYTFNPTMRIHVDGDNFYLDYVLYAASLSGKPEITAQGRIIFYSDSPLPDQLKSTLTRAIMNVNGQL